MTWYLDPSVLSIIERIRENPPQCVRQECYYGEKREEWWTLTGADVEALNAIWADALKEAMAAGDATGSYAVAREIVSARVEDVVCATTRSRLPGTLLTSQVELRAEIAAAIDTALFADRMGEAA